jgi:Galactose oxidase, central domain
MRTAVANEDSVVEDGQPIALPFQPAASSKNTVVSAGSAVQVFATGADTITWPNSSAAPTTSVICPANSSLTFFYALGSWYVVAIAGITLPAVSSLFTAAGQLLVGTGAATAELLSAGAAGTVLTVGGADPSTLEWLAPIVTPQASTVAPGWTLKTTATQPSARTLPGISFDTTNHLTYVFGGIDYLGVTTNQETWKWDGTSWTLLNPGTKPPARSGAGMCWYPTAGTPVTVLFGGTPDNGSTVIQTTYTFNGTTWTLKAPATKPSSRAYVAMCNYDPASVVMLFGGYNGTVNLQDTWYYNGTTWTQQIPLVGSLPPIRDFSAMAYSPVSTTVVLFGGSGSSYLNDTWIWNGTSWFQVFPSTVPPARASHTMTYDATTGQIIMYGGGNSSGNLNDAWSWNGVDWIPLPTGTTPPGQGGGMMVYDVSRANVALLSTDTAGHTYTLVPISGPPTTGTWVYGQEWVDNIGVQYVCILGGTPGQWILAPYDSSGVGPTMRVRMESPALPSLPNGGGAVTAYNFLDEDTANGLSTGTYTISRAGVYMVDGGLVWTASATGDRGIWFISGATGWPLNLATGVGPGVELQPATDDPANNGRMTSAFFHRFVVGDTVLLYAWHNTGGSLTLAEAYFGVTWLHD